MIWLLVACLWLPACAWPTANQSAPSADESTLTVDESSPATQESVPAQSENAPAEEESVPAVSESTPAQVEDDQTVEGDEAETAPATQTGVTIHLPFVSSDNQAVVDCSDSAAELMAGSIAGSFETSYEQVILWYCTGFTFDDILLALQTTAEIDISPVDLLAKLKQGQAWDEIWTEIGLLK
jgi:hypothetical protein